MAHAMTTIRAFHDEEASRGSGITRSQLHERLMEVIAIAREKEDDFAERSQGLGSKDEDIFNKIRDRKGHLKDEDCRTLIGLSYTAIAAPQWLSLFTDVHRARRSCLGIVREYFSGCRRRMEQMLQSHHSNVTHVVAPGSFADCQKPVDLIAFLHSHSRSHPANFFDFVRLLNKDRKRSWLEVLFTPQFIDVVQSHSRDTLVAQSGEFSIDHQEFDLPAGNPPAEIVPSGVVAPPEEAADGQHVPTETVPPACSTTTVSSANGQTSAHS